MIVTITIDIPFNTSCENGKNESRLANFSEKTADADAEVKKPDSVTPTCIIAKKLLEFSKSPAIFFACLCPSFAIFFILLSFKVIIAISDIAKNALTKISKKIIATCMKTFEFDIFGSISQNLHALPSKKF